ncbi:hypothetical protein [Rubripirellula lacrimiformis]|uniref:hypothetical protein n=1 Tax=Rubripirellula lacrimiformis TaxID=1930273 RepID=UPI00119CB965|nr:hypothetical protein [Rubripirellula lacrimiformis]
MSRFLRSAVAIASLVAILSSAGLASASRIHSTVERRQHPNVGLFAKAGSHHVSHVRLWRR